MVDFSGPVCFIISVGFIILVDFTTPANFDISANINTPVNYHNIKVDISIKGGRGQYNLLHYDASVSISVLRCDDTAG